MAPLLCETGRLERAGIGKSPFFRAPLALFSGYIFSWCVSLCYESVRVGWDRVWAWLVEEERKIQTECLRRRARQMEAWGKKDVKVSSVLTKGIGKCGRTRKGEVLGGVINVDKHIPFKVFHSLCCCLPGNAWELHTITCLEHNFHFQSSFLK